MNQADTIRQSVRFNLDVRHWLEQRAAKDLAPMNSVINAVLRQAMEAEQAKAKRHALTAGERGAS